MTTRAKQVLLVDDEEELLASIAQRMEVLGFVPHTATNGTAAIEIAQNRPIDIAIVDYQMPDMDGLVVITKLREIRPNLRTVLLTGHGGEKVRQATESLNSIYFEKDRMGDFWHFVRQLNANGHIVAIHPASAPSAGEAATATISRTSLRRDEVERKSAAPGTPALTDAGLQEEKNRLRIVGETAAMQELRKNIASAAPLDCTVTLKGEPGSGKELAARVIHAGSRYAHKRFLAINCANFNNAHLTEQLLGFSGGRLYEAIRTGSGIFGAEPVGTLFLDQVEKLSAPMQDQLMTTLTVSEKRTAGSQAETDPDIRIIVTTETDLVALVEAGTFSRELYDHLDLFELTVPPLRDRKDDIYLLCRYFFDQYRRELDKPVDAISPEVVEILLDYDFPGNVRELKNIIERAVIIVGGKTITRRHLPVRFLQDKQDECLMESDQLATMAELEKRYIIKVLEVTGGNKSKTAEILGISRAALWRKLKLFKAERSEE